MKFVYVVTLLLDNRLQGEVMSHSLISLQVISKWLVVQVRSWTHNPTALGGGGWVFLEWDSFGCQLEITQILYCTLYLCFCVTLPLPFVGGKCSTVFLSERSRGGSLVVQIWFSTSQYSVEVKNFLNSVSLHLDYTTDITCLSFAILTRFFSFDKQSFHPFC